MTGPRQAPTGYATLSLDLDDVWAYLRTRGEPDWASTPSILPLAAERLIAVLDDLGLRITVFVVGRDAERAGGQEAITALAQAGHEVASHSYLHRGELATLPAGEIAEDLRRTADAIAAVTGAAPRGFRCPSFGRSPALLQTLVDEGYRYDASVLPTWMAPVLKAFYAVRMRSRDRDGEPAGDLFGPAANALLPLTPFRWSTGSGQLLELPVSTVPVLRTPMHMSYQQALGAKSESAADHYLRWGLKLLYARSVPPSFLLHPTDVLDDRDARRLSYFPGMNRPSGAKVAQLRRALAALADRFEVVPLGEAARRLEGARLPARRSDAALRAPAELTRGRP